VKAVRDRGQFTVALSGGNTPKKLFQLLTDDYYKTRLPWNDIYLFWVDERCVAPTHPESNYGEVERTLLSRVTMPASHVFRMLGEMEPARDAAKAYENTLRAFFHVDKSLPVFDLILLGMGDDGHTASLFPGTIGLTEKERWVIANHVERLSADRITLTFPLINNARDILVLCQGDSKANTLKEVFRTDISDTRYPIQRIRPTSGSLRWLVDHAAAAKLPADIRYNASHI
jgi:6-phosphogluconolactonase